MDTGTVQNHEIRGVTGKSSLIACQIQGGTGNNSLKPCAPVAGRENLPRLRRKLLCGDVESARLFRTTFSTISGLQRWISVAAFAHDAVLRKRAISSLVSAATVVIHLSRAVSRSGSEIFSTSSSISTQRLSRKPSSDALVAKMPSIR